MRMQGISLVPDPQWRLMGAIISFYFGARHQADSQDFQRSISQIMARVPTVVENTRALQALRSGTPLVAQSAPSAEFTLGALALSDNQVLREW